MTRTLALITGASSGIGLAYARALAADCDFVLVARRMDRLADLAGELRDAGATADLLSADLGTRAGVATVTDRLAAGDVRLLISNAGAGGYARLAEVDPVDVDRLLSLNGVAPIELVRAVLPGMLAANEGTIITVASLLAFSAAQTDGRFPRRTLYAAAKAATVAFTRTLTVELTGTAIRTQVVCPGMVATEFNEGAGLTAPFAMSAEGVVQASLAGLRLGESICIPGLEDQSTALGALVTAETALIVGNRPVPATRYQQSGDS
ncbi:MULTISPECIES: SDR family oxidoreductase [unclassified Pseudofrankia]|uniref:SDR family NAD(P)-dependent oxidoreductase n=1 Tax=unclassified Pseudofrankia TaxID=2994372 RepID=UPI0009F6B9DD|nr:MULTISPECIES: SDR family NAD(P)-dependent oxidoreductase [unclassified Pseudofrankia]MDT3445809.1 SDR family NAD(P)-dependent oxidoreductase [Pseudofrankia sp. BMG5.37]